MRTHSKLNKLIGLTGARVLATLRALAEDVLHTMKGDYVWAKVALVF